jgi:hypothetical protein
MITSVDLEQHFLSLCAANEIQINWCERPSKALAISGEFEFVRVPRIKSPIAYAVAMHELGHIKGCNQCSKNQIVRERWAWAWARHNAILWTPRMERYAVASVRWYQRKWIQQRRRVPTSVMTAHLAAGIGMPNTNIGASSGHRKRRPRRLP